VGGLSSAYDARHLLLKNNNKQKDKDRNDVGKCEITVISDLPYFSFTPSNPWVAIGKRQPRDIQIDLASTLARHGISFVQGTAVQLNPVSKQLRLQGGTVVDYDYLIVATGPRLATEEIAGLTFEGEAGSSAISICTAAHAAHAAVLWRNWCKIQAPWWWERRRGPPALDRPMNTPCLFSTNCKSAAGTNWCKHVQ
jgi:NADPH-dependent 2,4-dienoyl-CoA reductase/sulfur reductase-like enzyme